MYESANNSSQDHSMKLNAEIKKAFPKLSDQEIGLLKSKPDDFYKAVEKSGIKRDEAEKTVKKLDAECAAACATSAKSTDKSATAPVAKAS